MFENDPIFFKYKNQSFLVKLGLEDPILTKIISKHDPSKA